MRFDNVLRYVAFHKIELQKPPLKDSKLQAKKLALQPRPGRGRNDLPFFFHWLRGKEVKHILKVIVEDTLERPHSDKAIEESLKHFEVESLEWRKLDICPETLFNACRDVRFLTLWWSGNRALLRAWSEPEGLPKLEKLEAVHLVWNSNEVRYALLIHLAAPVAQSSEVFFKDFSERGLRRISRPTTVNLTSSNTMHRRY